MVTVILWLLRWTPQGNKIPECLPLDGGDDSPVQRRWFTNFCGKIGVRDAFYGESLPCKIHPHTTGFATVGIADKGRMSRIWSESVARRSTRKKVLDS